jgi:hypothetical protein
MKRMVFVLAAAMAASSWAQQPVEVVTPSDPSHRPGILPDLDRPNGLEEWHDYWSADITRKVEYFDSFFGDERLKDDNEGTRVQLGLGLNYSGEDKFQFEGDFSMRLSLPQLENRWQVIVDSTLDGDDPAQFGTQDDDGDSDANAGVRYVFFENETWKFNTDTGIKISNPLEVFAKARGRFEVPFDIWELRLSDTLQWSSDDGVENKSDMTWSRPVQEKYLFKSVSAIVWREDEDGVTGKQSFQLLRNISRHSYWRFMLRGSWPEIPDVEEAVYGTEATYRRLLYSDWVFLEVTPGVEFLQENDYEVNPFLELLFDLIFEEDKTTGAAI